MRKAILLSALLLSSCSFKNGPSRVSSGVAEQHALGSQPLAVIITGFQAPRTLYGTFETAASELGMETLVISLPAEGVSPFRQDLSLLAAFETIAAKLGSTTVTRDLFLFGHSLGGKIATMLALLNPEHEGRDLDQQLGGHAQTSKQDIVTLQQSLRGVFLLDPVYEGVDANLVKRLQKNSNSKETSLLQDTVHTIDGAFVSVPIEELLPREPSGTPFRTLIVQAERGNKGKTGAELAETAQVLRPKPGILLSSIETAESTVARQLRRELPPCGPDFLTSQGKKIPGAELAYALFSKRMPVERSGSTGSLASPQSARGAKTEQADFPVTTETIKDAGHMDVVNLQPYVHADHQSFVRLCSTGPQVLQALGAMRSEARQGTIENPYHAEAVALWQNFLKKSSPL